MMPEMVPKSALEWLVANCHKGYCPAEADMLRHCPARDDHMLCEHDDFGCWANAAIEATRGPRDREVRIIVPGDWRPEAKRSYRRGKFTTRVDTADVVAFKAKCALAAAQVMGDRLPFEEPLALEIIFDTLKPKSYRKHENMPWKRPDLDNMEKPVLDAIDGIVMHDDAAFVEKYQRKQFGPREQCEVRIWPADPEWPYDKREDETV